MMEYWNVGHEVKPGAHDVEHKNTKILLNPLFHYSNIPLFQSRSEAELSSVGGSLRLRTASLEVGGRRSPTQSIDPPTRSVGVQITPIDTRRQTAPRSFTASTTIPTDTPRRHCGSSQFMSAVSKQGAQSASPLRTFVA